MLGILEADLARDFAERAGGDPVRGESAHKAKPITQIDTLPMRTTDSDCKSAAGRSCRTPICAHVRRPRLSSLCAPTARRRGQPGCLDEVCQSGQRSHDH